MNWQDCEPFVATLVVLGLSNADERSIETFWRIWQAGAGHGAQQVFEEMRGDVRPPEMQAPARKVILGVPEDVLEKARRLQALALDEAAAPQERENAWKAFEKIWKEHKLPGDFGL